MDDAQVATEKSDDGLNLDPTILDTVDLSLPSEFLAESLAEELLEHLSNYHKAKAANQAARHSGDNQKAEQMYRLVAYSRLAVAIIQHENPGVKAIADAIARFRAKRVQEQRTAVLREV